MDKGLASCWTDVHQGLTGYQYISFVVFWLEELVVGRWLLVAGFWLPVTA